MNVTPAVRIAAATRRARGLTSDRLDERVEGPAFGVDVTVRPERLVLTETVSTVLDAVTALDVEHEVAVAGDVSAGIMELVAPKRLPRAGSECALPGAEFDVIERLISTVHLHIRREHLCHSVGVTIGGSQRLGERHQPATFADDGAPLGRCSAELPYRRTVLQRGSVQFGVPSRKIDAVTVWEFVSCRRRERDHVRTLSKALDSRGIIEAERLITSDRNSLVRFRLTCFVLDVRRVRRGTRDVNDSFSADVFGGLVEDSGRKWDFVPHM